MIPLKGIKLENLRSVVNGGNVVMVHAQGGVLCVLDI